MNRADLRTRLLDAGFTFLTTTQANDFIDEAARELTLMGLWRFRTANLAGAPPLTVVNLGEVDSVLDGSNALEPRSRADVERLGVNINLAGSAAFYWVEQNNVVVTWPDTTSITVRHWSTKAWTTGTDAAGSDTDSPLAPVRFHDVVDLLARRRAKVFNDDFDEATAMQQVINLRLDEMRSVELTRPAVPRDPEVSAPVGPPPVASG